MARKNREKDGWQDWMGQLKYPIPKDELLDKGLASLIKLMNVPKKMHTLSSCLHDTMIILVVEDEDWFLSQMLPKILRLNDKKYGISVQKQYDINNKIKKRKAYRQKDRYNNQYCWVIKDGWRDPREFVKDLESVFNGSRSR